MKDAKPCEFDLHVWKKPGNQRVPDLYTVGVWNGMERAISSRCHIQPIEAALGIIRKVLEDAGNDPSFFDSSFQEKNVRAPRLAVEVECASCGPLSLGASGKDEEGRPLIDVAVRHTATTEQVVVLNGTTDCPGKPLGT